MKYVPSKEAIEMATGSVRRLSSFSTVAPSLSAPRSISGRKCQAAENPTAAPALWTRGSRKN
jgi:hypothetical protein